MGETYLQELNLDEGEERGGKDQIGMEGQILSCLYSQHLRRGDTGKEGARADGHKLVMKVKLAKKENRSI